ncbi:helix-turn-helix domain-containing protein [Rhizobium sp. NPDC090275]|uniref:helix-turn-helix domain-containing protein n=1 Tax=Rhizobium sp. NPDC090275 TaxID=3364498 RepID=UPI00383B0243
MSQIDTTPPASFSLSCPCCAQSVGSPSFEIVADHIGATPLESNILLAVWNGKGHPVDVERIYSGMYNGMIEPFSDDPKDLYRAFKVAVCHLRKKLKLIGWGIRSAGYRQGYFRDRNGKGGARKVMSLTDCRVQLVRLFAAEGFTPSEITMELGVSNKEAVRSTLFGRTYKNVI